MTVPPTSTKKNQQDELPVPVPTDAEIGEALRVYREADVELGEANAKYRAARMRLIDVFAAAGIPKGTFW